jgi:hypothetical protein
VSGIFSKQSLGFASDGYTVRTSTGGSLRMNTNGGSLNRSYTTASSVFVVGGWYLVTLVLKISSESDSVAAYVNNTKVISSSHGTDTYNEDNDLILGRGLQTGFSTEDYLNGRIGSFYFYNRRLTDLEIEENYNQTRARFGV